MKQIVFFSGGFPTCTGENGANYEDQEKTLSRVQQQNVFGALIHAIGVGPSANEVWMKKLAAQNGGSYVRIVR